MLSSLLKIAGVKNLVLKLGRGHVLFELNEPQYEEPSSTGYMPLPSLPDDVRARFEHLQASAIWPEVGYAAIDNGILQYT